MRYFICALGKINLGIPAGQVERILPVTGTDKTENENDEVYISIPKLLKQGDEPVHHGLVLKAGFNGVKKTTLLVPKIEIDLEIPDENIKRLPESFTGIYSYFSGACFTGAEKMTFMLNPEKLTENKND